MHTRNHWGGSFELSNNDINGTTSAATDHNQYETSTMEWEDKGAASRRHHMMNNQNQSDLDEMQQSWLLGPEDPMKKRKKEYVDLGCVVCKRKILKWSIIAILVVFFVVALPITITKSLPKHAHQTAPPDNYTLALHKALVFFNAQKCTSSLSLHYSPDPILHHYFQLRLLFFYK